MNTDALLDCTLRDGAYLIDKEFGDWAISRIIGGLMEAHIDYIEIGFLQEDGFGPGKTVFRNAADAARFIPADKKDTRFAVLADYSRFSAEHLEENPGYSFDIIRECFFKDERDAAVYTAGEFIEKGYEVFIQPVDILGYTNDELLRLLERCNRIEPSCFSIVDTFGSMYEEDMTRIFDLVNRNLAPNCKIGFHSHNNLQLSNALSQSFLRRSQGKRRAIVDCSVFGMGRGAGNTPTELIAQYMVTYRDSQYDVDSILKLIDDCIGGFAERCAWGYSAPFFLAGVYSAHVNNISYLLRKSSVRSTDIRIILDQMGADARKRYPYELVDRICSEYLDIKPQ